MVRPYRLNLSNEADGRTTEGLAVDGSIILPLSPLGSQCRPEDEQRKQLKKSKRVRLLLDARTELTNEELEVCAYKCIEVC
jgi:meiotic recombination protein REC8, fungi type